MIHRFVYVRVFLYITKLSVEMALHSTVIYEQAKNNIKVYYNQN